MLMFISKSTAKISVIPSSTRVFKKSVLVNVIIIKLSLICRLVGQIVFPRCYSARSEFYFRVDQPRPSAIGSPRPHATSLHSSYDSFLTAPSKIVQMLVACELELIAIKHRLSAFNKNIL